MNGPLSEHIGDWTELPDSLENRLAASKYLIECGLAGGPLEDICYRLTVKLAAERKASKDVYDVLSSEVKKWRTRFKIEHDVASGLLEDVGDLEDVVELLEAESDFNVSALITAQERLDNALATLEDLSPYINWEDLTR